MAVLLVVNLSARASRRREQEQARPNIAPSSRMLVAVGRGRGAETAGAHWSGTFPLVTLSAGVECMATANGRSEHQL